MAWGDDAVEALLALEDLLVKEDLIEYLELLVESGCARPEDLAMFDEGEIMDMAPKLVHRRKFLDLRRRYKGHEEARVATLLRDHAAKGSLAAVEQRTEVRAMQAASGGKRGEGGGGRTSPVTPPVNSSVSAPKKSSGWFSFGKKR